MRSHRVVLLATTAILLACGTLPVASSQADSGAPPARLLVDAEHDEVVSAAGEATPVTRWAASDLRFLDAWETPTSVNIAVGVRQIGAETILLLDDIFVTVDFTARDAPYRIEISYWADSGETHALWCQPEGSLFRCPQPISAGLDVPQATFSAEIPRELLLGADGSDLLKGDTIHSFAVEARSQGAVLLEAYSENNIQGSDRMPDEGTSTESLTIGYGADRTGHLELQSDAPVRSSNGEATTMLFKLNLRNHLDRLDTVKFEATGVQESWVVTLPSDAVRIEANSSLELPILATIPFFHQHGAFFGFNVTATSVSDPLASASILLGVRYTKIPQPSGHHPSLWIHSGSGSNYLNTLEDEDVPVTGGPATGSCSFSDPAASGTSTLVPLLPNLQMGLDAAMDQMGEASLVLESQLPIRGTASVGGYFVAWNVNEPLDLCLHGAPANALMELERSPPLSMEAGTPLTVKLPIHPLVFGDHLAYNPDLRFGLILAIYRESGGLPVCCAGTSEPELAGGSSFRLPLQEYEDDVNEYFVAYSGLELISQGLQQAQANTGDAVLFMIDATNLGSEEGDFAFRVDGTNADWAHLIGNQKLRFEPGEHRVLALAIQIPPQAESGEQADVVLHATSESDQNSGTLIRFLVGVDNNQEYESQASEVAALQKSLGHRDAPGFAVQLALFAVFLALRAKRT